MKAVPCYPLEWENGKGATYVLLVDWHELLRSDGTHVCIRLYSGEEQWRDFYSRRWTALS